MKNNQWSNVEYYCKRIQWEKEDLINYFIDNCNEYEDIIQWFNSFFQFDYWFESEMI